ncbi:MAG TPA: IS110 family transposase [Propionibacteriaceae bacterium]|nr:IS110 family transposase [Propionibacteriaceae bacterium]
MTNEAIQDQARSVGGIDSHKDTVHVAVITGTGRPVADREFPTTEAGYRHAVAWLGEHGPLQAVGVEGTSSYGVGMCAALTTAGVTVIEVNRTRPAERRKRGKTDPLDAYRAARSVLTGEAATDPKRASVEPLRALNVARRSAVKAQQAAWRQIGALLVNAPAPLRDRLRDLTRTQLLSMLVAARPGQVTNPDHADTLYALQSLARRHRDLGEEITALTERLNARTAAANPALMAIKGVGPVVGAQLLITAGDNPDRLRSSASFAALCGTAPIPVSSGRTDRYRLSRGGDRAANAALHQIVTVRMTYDPTTRAYRDTRLARGWTNKAIYRALKRAVAREIHRALIGRCDVPDYQDLRPARQAKNITLTQVADHFSVWPMHISTIERGTRRDDTLAQNYREWLTAA